MDADMVAVRKTGRRGAASVGGVVAVLAAVAVLGCTSETPPEPPSNTGPGTTVSRVTITAARLQVGVGDSILFRARAFDSAGNELDVTFLWQSGGPGILEIGPASPWGKGRSEGRTIVFANVGSMRSNVLDITVTQ
jgi:hypothetical protein